MVFNTEWDVDKYKTEYESEEHWQLRRCFMETHKNKFPEERLVCLAQVFTNIEFMGCRYPAETMELIGQLSQGVADGYREKQKTKLQRTFVKASDAAGAKVKGLKRLLGDAAGPLDSSPKIIKCSDVTQLPQNTSTTRTTTITPENSETKQLPIKTISSTTWVVTEMEPNIEKTSASHLFKTCAFVREEPSRNLLKEGTVQVSNNETKMNGYEQNYKPANNRGEVALMQAGPYGKLVLLEYEEQPHPYQVLIASMNHFHIPFHIEYKAEDSSMLCNVFVNNQLLSSSSGFNRKGARDKAVSKAYNKLKEMCYILKIKGGINSDDPVVERDHLKQFEPTFSPEKNEGNSLDIPLEENIGSKLMRAMGWTGGGLGKDRQGIQEPIRPTVLVRRGGIGVLDVKSAKEFEKKIFKILQEYKLSKETHSLTFSSDFTKEERVVAHQISQKLKLKSRSYGHGDDRKLVVSQKNNFGKVVEDMLLLGEYSNSKFQLIKPSIALPPENEQHAQLNCENNVKCEDAIVSGIETSAQVPENHPPLAVTENICPVTVQSIDVAMRNVVCERSQRSVDNITGPFGSFVLIEDEIVVTPIQLIKRSAHECHIPFKFEYGNVEKGGVVCRLLINNILVASSTEVTKKRARDMTISRSLVKLKDVCYTLKTQIKVVDGSIHTIKCLKKPNKRSVGFGKDSETHIVCVSKDVDRLSLGTEESQKRKWNKNKIRNFLETYLADSCPYDLIFFPEFSETEKSWIQKLASSLPLKITMYNVSMKEYMVMNKELSSIDLANAILMSGGNVSADSAQVENIFDL